MAARIQVLERDHAGGWSLVEERAIEPAVGYLLGREGDIGVGVRPEDTKVSRRAVTVTRTRNGWALSVTNRNGVVLHPWGQSAGRAEPECLVPWPKVALRVIGRPEFQHWVLLDDPSLVRPQPQPLVGTDLTESTDKPRPLTTAQEQAIRSLFRPLLAWPPIVGAAPRQIKQVARELGTTKESIQRRLEEVRKKAVSVGLSRVNVLTDPEYLYVLVRAGFLEPDPADSHPVLPTG